MLSLPPATITRASPNRTACEASMTAFSPEPHTLLMVSAATVGGSPALRAAWRAGACPTPPDRINPMITSSTSRNRRPARKIGVWIAIAPSYGAATPLSDPRNLPMGVRAPERTYASFIYWLLLLSISDANLAKHAGILPDEDAQDLPMITITGTFPVRRA